MSEQHNPPTLDSHRVQVVAGDAIVARWPNCVIVAAGTAGEMGAALDDLRPGLGTDEAATSAATIERIRQHLGRHEIAAVVALDDGLHVLASVTMHVVVDGSPLGDDSRIDERLEEVDQIWIGVASSAPPLHQAESLDLLRGAVPGSGVHLLGASGRADWVDLGQDRAGGEPSDGQEQSERPDGPDDPTHPPTSRDESPELETPERSIGTATRGLIAVPTPMAEATAEPPGLFSALVSAADPDGAAGGGSGVTVRLVFDNGAEAVLDRTTEVGQAPAGAGGADTVTVLDESATVATTHAQIRFDPAGDVWLIDYGSPHGSFVWAAPTAEWLRVDPQNPFPVNDGSFFSIGQRRFRVEVTPPSPGTDVD